MRRRLVGLRRLGVCTDLEPEDETDLLRLWLERNVVLAIDGGGYYVIWVLQLLIELERVANDRAEGDPPEPDDLLCQDLFDVVAGSSAGAVTVALILKGKSAREIERFWMEDMPRIWDYKNPLYKAALDLLLNLNLPLAHHLLRTSLFSFDPPLLDKKKFRAWAKKEFGDETIASFCKRKERGLFLLSKNVATGQNVPAGALFNAYRAYDPDEEPIACDEGHERIRVRAALEAAVSPPLVFQPLGPYTDAGLGPENDPTLVVLKKINQLRHTLRKRKKRNHPRYGYNGKIEEIFRGLEGNTAEYHGLEKNETHFAHIQSYHDRFQFQYQLRSHG